jgi:predicted component of type VI protein secretion system
MPKLVLLVEGKPANEYPLAGSPVKIGRAADNTVQIFDDSVSSHHAELTTEGDSYVLRDIGSTNGTKVNNDPLPPNQPRKLTGGEVVKFGGMECRYDSEGKRPASKPLPPVKAGVDLKSATATRPSTVFQNVSPFKKKVDKSSRIIQVIIYVVAASALASFLFLLWKFLQQH